MNVADKARAAAMQFEAKKDALGQVQSGDWKLRFTVSPEDVPNGLLTAPMGTRYQVVIVELGDDEQPVAQKPENKHRLSQQAAILCDEYVFQQYLLGNLKGTWGRLYKAHESRDKTAASCVREICKVDSRSDFDKNPEAAARWRNLKAEYEAWKLL